jgi:hypothetical protein
LVQADLGKKQDPISKITRAKMAGGMAQPIEHLLHRKEVQSSNSRTAKNNQNISWNAEAVLKEKGI